MPEKSIPVEEFWIDGLVRWCPRTAAQAIPLVMWADLIHGGVHIAGALSGRFPPELGTSLRSPLGPQMIWRHMDFCSLYIVRQGKGTHVIEGTPYGVARGDVYVMGRGMAHHFCACDRLELDTIHFSPRIFDPPTRDALAQTPGLHALFLEDTRPATADHPQSSRWLHLPPDTYEQIRRMVSELREEWLSNTPSGVLMTRCLFLRLLVHLARLYADNAERVVENTPRLLARYEATVPAVVRYMEEHFTEPIRIEQLASMVFLSPDRFTEVFSRLMGRTPRDYLRHLRLERAKALLQTTDLSITAIAHEAGFQEVAYFIRVFRSETGMTPGAYRKTKYTA